MAEWVKQIEQQGWEQGAIVAGNALLLHVVGHGYPPDLWVLVTQTCTIVNPSATKVTTLEWLPIWKKNGKPDNKMLDGRNPRDLHYPGPDGTFYATKIESKAISARCDLPTLLNIRAEHPHLDAKWLEQVIHLLKTTYDRPALQDAFNGRMRTSGFGKVLDTLALSLNDDINSIWLRVQVDDIPLEQHCADNEPTCGYHAEIRFAVKAEALRKIPTIQTALTEAMAKTALFNGLTWQLLAVPMSQISLSDIADGFVRYTSVEWLSIVYDAEEPSTPARASDEQEQVVGQKNENAPMRTLIGRIACLFGCHQWQTHAPHHYVLKDSGDHTYECVRCGKLSLGR